MEYARAGIRMQPQLHGGANETTEQAEPVLLPAQLLVGNTIMLVS